MNTKESKMKQGGSENNEFWKKFQLSPWKWVDELTNRSRYSVASIFVVYAIYAYMTFFPARVNSRILLLTDYPSINIILPAFSLVMMLAIRWRHQIPSIFQWLLESNRLESQGDDLKNEFEQYLQDYQKKLLSRTGPLSLSISFLVLFLIIGIWAGVLPFIATHFTSMAVLILYTTILVCLFWLFMMGQLSWVLYVTSRQVGKLTQDFVINIQPQHADKCGGLRPLGDFFFDAALPLIGGGLILSLVPILHWDIDDVLGVFATITIFALIGPLTAITVFMPLWNIHNEMTKQRRAYEDGFATQAMALEQTVRTHTSEKGSLRKAEIAKAKLEILQSVNPDKITYPVWPFRFTGTVLALLSPQILKTLVDMAPNIYDAFF